MRIGFVRAKAGAPATTLDEIVAETQSVEADGFAFYSVPAIFSLDAIGMLTVAGRETSRIELVPAVVYLLSPAAAYVSGETMKVDGATSVFKNMMVPIGHHDGTPKWDGFHLRTQLGGLYKKADEAGEL
jgi:hypothetical protein